MLSLGWSKFNIIRRGSRVWFHKSRRSVFTKSILNQANSSDGKTTVSVLNKSSDVGLLINSYSAYGFRLNNKTVVIGPMIIFPRSVLSWNIRSANDITAESLTLFKILEPKFDVLVIGVGDQHVKPGHYRNLITPLRNLRANIEILSTEKACATFNFLNSENRMVAAALIPPSFSDT